MQASQKSEDGNSGMEDTFSEENFKRDIEDLKKALLHIGREIQIESHMLKQELLAPRQ